MSLFPNEHETIEGVGRALRAGRTSCVAVLEKCLDRIEEWEPRIKAWVRVDRAGALRQARELDEELAAGKCRGPLHGIPIGIKDIIDVKGLPTAAGFAPLRNRVVDHSAALVGRLELAGAVILGKTVTTQFAWIDPPPTRNPWNLDRTPGGSSSGSAAAVALGMCLGAIGTQTGGSIIRPASFCGVCGFKPTHDAVSTHGILPFAFSLDHPGPIARTTGDLKLLFESIRDPRRGESEGVILDRSSAPGSGRLRPPTLSRPRWYFDERADRVMVEALDHALKVLIRAGVEVIDLPADLQDGGILDFEQIVLDHRTIMAVEAARFHQSLFSGSDVWPSKEPNYAPRIRALIEEGLATTAVQFLNARDLRPRRQSYLKEMLGPEVAGDAIVTPATIGPAPDPSTTGDPAFNSPWSYLGWPAVSFPIGLTPDGLPLGLQLLGVGPGVDTTLLETASWCEDVIRRAFHANARSD
jgi:Asp-tRNA(Asn)/Glu-tRNA(Gln) amidotransferase A subunit family amidase